MNPTRALKVHLRVLEIHGRTLRVVTLRPQTTVRFSTNYFHETWHILVGSHGAMILGRLLWGLAFQRLPGTLVVIEAPHVQPTPFDADPAAPIAIVPTDLTHLDADLLRALRLRLRRAPGPPTTIRWHTFGMPAALAAPHEHDDRVPYHRERMSRRGGYICYAAPSVVLRAHGRDIYRMHERSDGYYPLAFDPGMGFRYAGEVQVVPRFDRACAEAAVARREVLGSAEPGVLVDPELQSEIWDRAEVVAHRNRRGR